MKNIKKFILAIRLDYHWSRIKKYQKRLNALVDSGEPLSSHKVLSLNNVLSHHCCKAMVLDKLFLEATKPNSYT